MSTSDPLDRELETNRPQAQRSIPLGATAAHAYRLMSGGSQFR